METCTEFRPIVLDGNNIGMAPSHLQPEGKSGNRFSGDAVISVVERLLKLYLSLWIELETFGKLVVEVRNDRLNEVRRAIKVEDLKEEDINSLSKKIRSDRSKVDFQSCSNIWLTYPELPLIYIFLEAKIEEKSYKELFDTMRQYSFISFLILPDGGLSEEASSNKKKVYGDRLLLDFAATVDAVIISKDQFRDVTDDPLFSGLEKDAVKNEVEPFFATSSGDILVNLRSLERKVKRRPRVSTDLLFGDIPNKFVPLLKSKECQGYGTGKEASEKRNISDRPFFQVLVDATDPNNFQNPDSFGKLLKKLIVSVYELFSFKDRSYSELIKDCKADNQFLLEFLRDSWVKLKMPSIYIGVSSKIVQKVTSKEWYSDIHSCKGIWQFITSETDQTIQLQEILPKCVLLNLNEFKSELTLENLEKIAKLKAKKTAKQNIEELTLRNEAQEIEKIKLKNFASKSRKAKADKYKIISNESQRRKIENIDVDPSQVNSADHTTQQSVIEDFALAELRTGSDRVISDGETELTLKLFSEFPFYHSLDLNTDQLTDPQQHVDTEEVTDPQQHVDTEEVTDPQQHVDTEEVTDPQQHVDTEEVTDQRQDVVVLERIPGGTSNQEIENGIRRNRFIDWLRKHCCCCRRRRTYNFNLY